MYKRIVVGVDGSEQSNHAFAKALVIAEASEATLIIGHVMDIRNFPNEHLLYSGQLWEEWKGVADELLQAHKKQAEAKGVVVETAFSSGNPRIQVAKELTKDYEADLLITSATGRNRIDRLFTGSVAEAAMRHSPCDYLIVKGYENASNRYTNIVVGIDGSNQSENAVREAAILAKEHGSDLTIVYVLPVSSYQGVVTSSPELMEKREREKIKDMLASNKERAEEMGALNVKTEFLYGSPREKFSTGLSNTINPDLIVIGSTGTNMVTRFMIGSVAEAAMRHAPCDVLTVK